MQSLEIQMYLHALFPCVIMRRTCDGVGRINRIFLINKHRQYLGYFPNKGL